MKQMKHSIVLLLISIVLVLNSFFVIAAPKKQSPVKTNTTQGIKVQFFNYYTDASINTIYPEFRIYNTGNTVLYLKDIKARYYFTKDSLSSNNFWCDWSNIEKTNITGLFSDVSLKQNADTYLEIGFNNYTGTLSPGAYVEVQSRITKTNWSFYTQTDDYSFNSSASSYTDWNKVTGYIQNNLAWGTEPPSVAPTPTNTPTLSPTPSPTPTNTPTPSSTPSPTSTNTPTPSPTPSPTPTNTPTPSPTPSPTPTNTPTPSSTPSPTPTNTPTPSPTPSPTPTNTPTPSPTPSPTPTNTPTPSPTPSPTPTNTPAPSPTPTPSPTPPAPSGKDVLGFTTYYYNGDKTSYNSMLNNISSLNDIATATHLTDGNGNITGLFSQDQIDLANKNGISPFVMIGNNFSGSIAKTLLESPQNRQNFINNLLNIINAHGYKGTNIDLEGIYSANRNDYTQFIKEIYNTLKPLGYKVSVSVPAKTYDNPSNSWSGAYDYGAIASYADQILIMAYDEHYPGGTPGPVASINWVTNVVKYATTVIPNDKIYLGIAAYGYDWYSNQTKAYSINGCINLANNNSATILWDNTQKCPYFTYKDSAGVLHTVWFENHQSLSYKLDLVNSYDLKGVGIWRLGLENPDYWNVINQKIK